VALEQARQEATRSEEEYHRKLAEIQSRMPRHDFTTDEELARFRANRSSGSDPFGAHQAELEKNIYQQKASEAAARLKLETEEIHPLEASRKQQVEAEQQSLRQVENTIGDCVRSTPIPPLPVRFQFLLSADKKTFEINYVDEKVFRKREAREVLDFIYR
jgi:hypothetical protein